MKKSLLISTWMLMASSAVYAQFSWQTPPPEEPAPLKGAAVDEMRAYGFGGMLSHFSWCRVLNDYGKGEPMDWLINKF